ncbi:MAG: VCBS repeat-containing protein, partial [Bacteroidetes bacterium]
MKFSIKNILFFFCLFYFSCENKKIENQNNTEKKSEKPTLFTLLNSQQTGIGFANQLTEKEDLNILNYLYFYNGAGVAVGDINNDGLADIYFTANQLPNKLYLNKGNFVFEDITEKAGVAGS